MKVLRLPPLGDNNLDALNRHVVEVNKRLEEVARALDDAKARQVLTGDLDAGGFRITNIGTSQSENDAISSSQMQGIFDDIDDAFLTAVTSEGSEEGIGGPGNLFRRGTSRFRRETEDAIIQAIEDAVTGTPGQVAYFTEEHAVRGDSGLTYNDTLNELTITGQIVSTLVTGTAPFVVASTTKVDNLNVDLLDGRSEEEFLLLAGRTGTTNDPIISLDDHGTIYGSDDATKALLLASSTDAAPEVAVVPHPSGVGFPDGFTIGPENFRSTLFSGGAQFALGRDQAIVGDGALIAMVTLNGGTGNSSTFFGVAGTGSFDGMETVGDFDNLFKVNGLGIDADNNIVINPSACAFLMAADGPAGSGFVPGQALFLTCDRNGVSKNRFWIKHNGLIGLGPDVGYPEGLVHISNYDDVDNIVLVVQGAGAQAGHLTQWEGRIMGELVEPTPDAGVTTLTLVDSTAFAASGIIWLVRADSSIGSDLPVEYSANNTGTGELTLVDPLPFEAQVVDVYQSTLLSCVTKDGWFGVLTQTPSVPLEVVGDGLIDGDCEITGKLTVGGALDPTMVLLTGADKRFGATDSGTVYLAPFADSTSAVEVRKADNTTPAVIFDTTNRQMGIGSDGGLAFTLDVVSSLSGTAGITTYTSSAASVASALTFARARGSQASPSQTLSGDRLGELRFVGFDGSDFDSVGAGLRGVAAENVGASAAGTHLDILTTPIGSTTAAARGRWDSEGRLAIGHTSPVERVDISGNLQLKATGNKLLIKEGSNASMGRATLVAGTVTVTNTLVSATSEIYVTSQVDGGVPGFLRISARTVGTNFTITSSNALDTSDVAWLLIEPAP